MVLDWKEKKWLTFFSELWGKTMFRQKVEVHIKPTYFPTDTTILLNVVFKINPRFEEIFFFSFLQAH